MPNEQDRGGERASACETATPSDLHRAADMPRGPRHPVPAQGKWPSREAQAYDTTREDVIAQGYVPCKVCNP